MQILEQTAAATAATIRDLVGDRLTGSATVSATALAQDTAAAEGFLADGNWVVFAADEGAAEQAAATPLWNVWVDANLTGSERDDPFVGNDGSVTSVSGGIDRRIGDRAVLGALINYEMADFDTRPSDGTLETEGGGVGAYGGIALTDTIVLDGLVLWKALDNDVADPFGRGSYDSTRWLAATNITGYFFVDRWRLSPTAGLSWSEERQDAYVDSRGLPSPSKVAEKTTLSAGLQMGYTFDLGDGASLEPWLGVTASWDVDTSRRPPPTFPDRELDEFDVTVVGGLKAKLTDRASLALKASIGGLARSDYDVVSGSAQLSFKF
jgi:outer membrane autotransporter protein